MNEDDTFRRLKQTPFLELNKILSAMPELDFDFYLQDSELRDKFLASHGWTWEEFTNTMSEVWLAEQKRTFGF